MEKVIKKVSPGSYVLIGDEPCRVVKTSSAVTSKHGHAKVRIEAVGIFDGRRRELVKPSNAMVSVPIITKKSAQVLSVSGDAAQLMDMQSYETFELSVPAELCGKVAAGKEAVYWEIDGKKVLMSVR